MGFTFGFTEDIDEDLVETTPVVEKKNPIDEVQVHSEPKIHSISDILKQLVNHRLTYENSGYGNVYRRSVYDVRHQLMLEDEEPTDEFDILVGQIDQDLKNGVYEGGLKSWECSFDLIKVLETTDLSSFDSVCELGCGSMLPTLYLMQQKPLKSVILSDFNYNVLRLVTVPNIFINWCLNSVTLEDLERLQQRPDVEGNVQAGNIDVTEQLVEEFLKTNPTQFTLISGSWCREFMDIVTPLMSPSTLLLTSETIYSPAILPVVGEIILELGATLTLLAAKDIYFGVGGSVVEFQQYMRNRNVSITTTAFTGALTRSVLAIVPTN